MSRFNGLDDRTVQIGKPQQDCPPTVEVRPGGDAAADASQQTLRVPTDPPRPPGPPGPPAGPPSPPRQEVPPRGWPIDGLVCGQPVWKDYVAVAYIGHGATGYVYEIIHRTEAHWPPLAIKLMRQIGDHALGERLYRQEINCLYRVQEERGQRRFVRIHDVGRVPPGHPCSGAAFFVMELLTGQTLAQLLRDLRHGGRRLHAFDFLYISREMLAAMQEAHGRPDPIVHRDLKPDNFFLHSRQEAGEEKVDVVCLDLGLAGTPLSARHRIRSSDELLCPGGIGTPPYVAPEVWDRDLDRISCAADVFSLGVLLYEMATGLLPYGLVHGAAQPIPPGTPLDLSPVRERHDLLGLDRILARALCLSPPDDGADSGTSRYREAGEMLADLEQLEAWRRREDLWKRAEAWLGRRDRTEWLLRGQEARTLLEQWHPEHLHIPSPRAVASFMAEVRTRHEQEEAEARRSAAAAEAEARRTAAAEDRRRIWSAFAALVLVLPLGLAIRGGYQRLQGILQYEGLRLEAGRTFEQQPMGVRLPGRPRGVGIAEKLLVVATDQQAPGGGTQSVLHVYDPHNKKQVCQWIAPRSVRTVQEQIQAVRVEGNAVLVWTVPAHRHRLDLISCQELEAPRSEEAPPSWRARQECLQLAESRGLPARQADQCEVDGKTAVFAGSYATDVYAVMVYNFGLAGRDICTGWLPDPRSLFSPQPTDLCAAEVAILRDLGRGRVPSKIPPPWLELEGTTPTGIAAGAVGIVGLGVLLVALRHHLNRKSSSRGGGTPPPPAAAQSRS